MADLKLPKLPDRTPVRITITVSPALSKSLQGYAELYREAYGEEETVPQLIPFMLETFLRGDSGFAKARREKVGHDRRMVPKPQRPRPPATNGASTSS